MKMKIIYPGKLIDLSSCHLSYHVEEKLWTDIAGDFGAYGGWTVAQVKAMIINKCRETR